MNGLITDLPDCGRSAGPLATRAPRHSKPRFEISGQGVRLSNKDTEGKKGEIMGMFSGNDKADLPELDQRLSFAVSRIPFAGGGENRARYLQSFIIPALEPSEMVEDLLFGNAERTLVVTNHRVLVVQRKHVRAIERRQIIRGYVSPAGLDTVRLKLFVPGPLGIPKVWPRSGGISTSDIPENFGGQSQHLIDIVDRITQAPQESTEERG